MKTVAIVGSPRKDGNCDILVDKVLEKIDGEKSIYYLNELDIGFCKAFFMIYQQFSLIKLYPQNFLPHK